MSPLARGFLLGAVFGGAWVLVLYELGDKTIAAGGLIGLCLASVLINLRELHASRSWKRKFRNLPVASVAQRNENGDFVAIVTKMDGTIVTVELPGDYDPSEDGGRRLMAEVAPELLNLIYEEE